MTRILIDTDVIFDFFFDRDHSDFEDVVQNYSAETNKEIDLVITRNTKDYKWSTLGVMTPNNYLNSRLLDH